MARSNYVRLKNGTNNTVDIQHQSVDTEADQVVDDTIIQISDEVKKLSPAADDPVAEICRHADEYLGKLNDLSSEEQQLLDQQNELKRQLDELEAKQCKIAAAKKEAEEKVAEAKRVAEEREKARAEKIEALNKIVATVYDELKEIVKVMNNVKILAEEIKVDL